MSRWLRLGTLAVLASVLAHCAGARSDSPSVLPETVGNAQPAVPPIGKYIKHIVIIVQENRSFEDFFAGYPGADAPMYGNYKNPATGVVSKVPLKPVGFLNVPDILHTWQSGLANYDGGAMDGFQSRAYAYVPRPLVAPIWKMAQSYALADRFFATEFGASFTAHLDLVAGTTNLSPTTAEINYPDGAWRCNAVAGTTSTIVNSQGVISTGPFPCFTQFNSIAQVLDKAGVSWKFYNAVLGPTIRWDPFDSIKYVWDGPDETRNIIQPQQQVILDAQKNALPAVSWVTPDYYDSDHAGNDHDTGPSWVAAIVNAIGESPEWNSTAIFITWDDWGGWYDDAVPPQLNFVGLGERVPLLMVSPYAKKGYVSHTLLEFASTLKFIEQTEHLPVIGPPSFGYTDTRAASPLDMFDFTQKPRAYTKIPAKYPLSYFLNEKPSMKAPDDN